MVDFINVRRRFLFNLSGSVGQSGRNQADDVDFVRLGYKQCALNPKFLSNSENKTLIPTIGKMAASGPFASDLDEVIRQHEAIRGGTQDGLVSVIRDMDATHGLYDGKHSWIVISLNNNMIDTSKEYYPRLDKIDGCGVELSKTIISIFRLDLK